MVFTKQPQPPPGYGLGCDYTPDYSQTTTPRRGSHAAQVVDADSLVCRRVKHGYTPGANTAGTDGNYGGSVGLRIQA